MFPLSILGLDEEIKRDELGPNRHSAEFRIKKSQVYTIPILPSNMMSCDDVIIWHCYVL